ncbi:MAG: HEAT repeat domain-containing protein [Phycisphaeraceae bacterium]|nr:HEAT repeat domain-containing protein [Phycisphaeraceae bacterium]
MHTTLTNTTMRTALTHLVIALTLTLALCRGAALAAPADTPAPEPRAVSLPPDLPVDYRHMKLEITIPDMNVPRFTATASITFAPIVESLSTITLDAKAFEVSAVTMAGQPLEFEHKGKKLDIRFNPPLPRESARTIVISYAVTDPPLGLIWSPAGHGRDAQLHTQGQPQTNSYWFPCHDYPNDRLTTELIVTVPAGYTASSNGRLIRKSQSILPVERPGVARTMGIYDTWHWLQDKPHVNYLVSLVVGKFDIVDVGTRQISMPVYVPPGRGKDVPATFGRTPQMLEHFARILDEPYPWDRYAQLVVWNFGAGGMENTAATTLYEACLIEPSALIDFDYDGLISHELAHQWFGNLITCNSWDHIWLNEGITTYLTSLWFEKRDGIHGYERSIGGSMDSVAGVDLAEAPARVGMTSNIFMHPWETFRREANPYTKGASVMHMLRMRLGDDVFFRALAAYVERHKFTTVETIDLQRVFEEVSGETLGQFFHQWTARPGVPHIAITADWTSDQLTLSLTQTQRIDGDNPAFEFDLPVQIAWQGRADATTHTLAVRGRDASLTIPAPAQPRWLAVDPRRAVLARVSVSQPVQWSIGALEDGPTLYSRVLAARTLATEPRGPSTPVLQRFAMSQTNHHWPRAEAIRALAAQRAHDTLRAIATTHTNHWEVRQAIAEALPSLARDGEGNPTTHAETAERLLIDRLQRDPSVKVRAAAMRGLGGLRSANARPLIDRALNTDSQEDALKQAAIAALTAYNDPAALTAIRGAIGAMPFNRTRAEAALAIGRLREHNPDDALESLLALLREKDVRVSRAAGDALVAAGETRAIPELEKLLAATRSEELAWQLAQWLKALRRR